MTKEKLIDTIREISDQAILDDIHRLLEIELNEENFETSSAQKKKIQIARNEVANDNVIDKQTADKRIDEWLNE